MLRKCRRNLCLAAGLTVYDDDEADQLVGLGGLDWFFADLDGLDGDDDRLRDRRRREAADLL